MKKHRKSWTAQEKLAAVQALKSKGISECSREYSISSTTLYNWERQYDQFGIDGLNQAPKKDRDLQLHALNKEIRELKLIVADKELALRAVNELLKKSR